MSSVFHRHCHQRLPTVVKGEGVYLVDSRGKRYLDGCGGAAVSNLGHSHPRIKQAIAKQLASIPFAHTGFFSSESAEALAIKLCDLAPDSFNHAYFVSGGSEAVEAAVKMARQYFVERGESHRTEIIARRQSYHGNTLGALSVGQNQWRRAPFSPMLIETHQVSACYAYREQGENESDDAYTTRLAHELEAKIVQLGAHNVMAFVAEPIVGATAGVVPATKGYFQKIRQICDKYGVLLILDEVMCGVGRSGSFFAFEQEGIEPDLVALAKGLAAGYQPIGAVLASDAVYETIANGSGFFQHGHTFMAHPMACAAALATLQVIQEESLLVQVRARGNRLYQSLQQEIGHLGFVGDIRGRGLFWGIELVRDKQTKAPLAIKSAAHQCIKATAMQHGLMCYPMAGTIDGEQGHHILLAPPFVMSEAHIDELVLKLSATLKQCSKKWDYKEEANAKANRDHRCA